MFVFRVPAAALVALAMPGCAPPERLERDAALIAAAETCLKDFPGAAVRSVDMDGRLQLEVQADPDRLGIMRCVEDALLRSGALGGAPGRLAMSAPFARAAIRLRGPEALVPVSVNGVDATFVLYTTSVITLLRPAFAQRAGIEAGMQSSRVQLTVGGAPVAVPLVRLRSLRIDSATVEGIDVGIYHVLPELDGIDGVLGRTFLDHFKVNLDRNRQVLWLEPTQ